MNGRSGTAARSSERARLMRFFVALSPNISSSFRWPRSAAFSEGEDVRHSWPGPDVPLTLAPVEGFMSLREDVAVGWEALDQWGTVARVEPLAGGVGVNEVWSVRVNGQLAVGRLGRRSDADLLWETELLQHLDREGMTVPLPTADGRYFAD